MRVGGRERMTFKEHDRYVFEKRQRALFHDWGERYAEVWETKIVCARIGG